MARLSRNVTESAPGAGGFGGLAFWVLRLIFDAPGTVAGFHRWVLATAPVAPGVRAGLTADGGPRALARRWP